MAEFVCIQAHGDHVPGDVIDVPEGAAVAGLYWAPPGDPQARQFAEKTPLEAARAAVGAPAAADVPDDPPEAAQAVSEPPGEKAGK
jgi:hypothetical protein